METSDSQGAGVMSKDDSSNSNVYTCKRKLGETLDSKESVDNTSKYKKARHPWQIKGISFERNIISQEVRITEDDPRQMVGVIKYEEKGILSVNLSELAERGHINPKSDTNISQHTSTSPSVLNDHSAGPSTSSCHPYSKFDSMDMCNKQDISDSQRHSGNSNNTNEVQKGSTEPYIEEESHSLMEHESSGITSHRDGRNGMDEINPTLNFQQSVWQKREMGCAIVDNVFNKTLEEMGLSPDPKVNRFATDRLQIVEQGIDAAINQQGLFPQHSRPGQMEQSASHSDMNIPDPTKSNQQDHVNRRRMSLEEIPISKAHFTRRSSQPLSALGFRYRGQNCSNLTDEAADNATHSIDDDNKPVDSSEEDVAINCKSDVGSPTDTDCNTMTSIPDQFSADEENGCNGNFHVSDPKTGSENILDLAVSTAIKSQGLSL